MLGAISNANFGQFNPQYFVKIDLSTMTIVFAWQYYTSVVVNQEGTFALIGKYAVMGGNISFTGQSTMGFFTIDVDTM